MAVMVPTMVETTVAMTAIDTVVQIDSINALFLNMDSYHFVENPVKFVRDLELLKLNTTT